MNKTRQVKVRYGTYELRYQAGGVQVLQLPVPLLLGYVRVDGDGGHAVRTYSDYVLCDDVLAAAAEFLRECMQEEKSKSRARAAARGETVVRPPKSVAIANRKKLEAVKFRRLLMQEVLHNWYEMPATKFIAWLEKEAGED